MSIQIALLRAVNVGGATTLPMARLKTMAENLGFEARTLLQSGNLILRGATGTGDLLEKLLAAETATRLKLNTEFFVRDAKEWDTAIKANPFSKEAKNDPSHLVMMALKQTAKATDVKVLEASIKGRERIAAEGKQLYVFYPDGIGRSKLTLDRVENALGTKATGRNWNTVTKLAAIAADFPRS